MPGQRVAAAGCVPRAVRERVSGNKAEKPLFSRSPPPSPFSCRFFTGRSSLPSRAAFSVQQCYRGRWFRTLPAGWGLAHPLGSLARFVLWSRTTQPFSSYVKSLCRRTGVYQFLWFAVGNMLCRYFESVWIRAETSWFIKDVIPIGFCSASERCRHLQHPWPSASSRVIPFGLQWERFRSWWRWQIS